MSAQDAQQELLDEFEFFDNWMDRYQYIIDLGKQLPEYPDEWKTEAFKIEGCQSQVWIRPQRQGDYLHFDAISDAAIVSGLIAILMKIYNDRTPQDILETPPDSFMQALGLDKHLSPTRSNGLHAMIKRIFTIAQLEQ
ncbi:Fe-S cluster assembly protein SufE [Terasakiispira papahanaumokuakeensis]|uniref:Fe-S cluster assembly protein SufE n=1 Tax=Terasakiispira papahanaumokuakeensis TaxID=197479 RepID=A0A1E2V8U1_9GAMM|nr:SufE family protein [Terasakiispira papahanaumokuakeensis]ODC03394.1 Fe-S cluster assembly protein SufE [Terasakiispira papahanaumokuakeensis]